MIKEKRRDIVMEDFVMYFYGEGGKMIKSGCGKKRKYNKKRENGNRWKLKEDR